MKMNVIIEKLLNAPEGEHYEFKEAKNRFSFDEALKYCCALANCGGGKLVLGVSDKRPRQVVSSNAFMQPERTCKGLRDKLQIRIDFQLYDFENKRVLVFDVESHPVGLPVQADGIAWWRDGDSLIPMPETVRHSIYNQAGHDFSSEICSGITLNDLDNGAIKKFRKRWKEFSGNKRVATLSDEQLLRDCGLITDKGITYAALILFGKRVPLRRELPHAEVCFEYRSKEAAGPAAQREDFDTGYFSYDDRIWELVNLRNDLQHYQKRFAMLPVPTFNEHVVREAVLNAVSHRNYQMGGSIFVRQYQNRLVVESPGGFPDGITVENILNRQKARNKLIADIFKLCGLVERSGQGMNLIYELTIREAKPLPDFTGSDEYFVMLNLVGKVIDSKMLAYMKRIDESRLEAMTTIDYLLLSAMFTGRKDEFVTPENFEHLKELELVRSTEHGIELIGEGIFLLSDRQAVATSDCQPLKTTARKEDILDFIKNVELASSAEISAHIGLSQARVRTILRELADDNLIEKSGDNRFAKYSVKH